MKKRVFSLLLAFIMIFSCLSISASAKTSEWRYWAKGFNGVKAEGLCTHQYENHYRNSYWGAVAGHNCTNYIGYMLTMKGLDGVVSGNASAWDNYARNNGYRVDATPTVGSIAQWNSTYSSYGHVAFVEEVNPGYIVISEDNYGGDYDYRFINRGDPDWPENFIHFRDGPAFDHQSSTPAQNPWMELGAVTDITETRVKLNATVRNPSAVTVTAVGCYIWDESGKLIRDHIEEMNSSFKTRDYVPAWFWTDSELGMTLKSGAKYRYQVFCKTSNGTVIKSKEDTFYTQGPPINVSLSADINHGETIYSERVINFKLYAEHADSYIFEIWKDDTRVYYNDRASGSISYTVSDIGSYSARLTAVKGTYKSPAKEIRWQVIDRSSDISNEPSLPPDQGVPDANEPIKFIDVPSGKWYTEFVDYVAEHNLMNGMSENTFAPAETLTRAMFVQILANAAGVDTGNRNVITKFADVPSGKWYTSAVLWASENGIVNGMTESTFDPQGNIQRQQVCVMLARFAEKFGCALGVNAAKVDFKDDSLIQNYAKEAVYACQQAGIINGMTADTFAPRDNATRAQIAKIMTVFHKNSVNAEDNITQAINYANEVFVNPETDYIKAIDIIRTAMQKYPNSLRLEERYNYYMQFIPVSIFDLKPYVTDKTALSIKQGSDTEDNMGNIYNKAFHGFMSENQGQTYDISKKYNVLNGVVGRFSSSGNVSSSVKGYIKIYGDGRLLWSDTKIVASTKPYKISVDITGITDLKIEMGGEGNMGWSGIHTMFADVTLQRTLK